MTSPTSETRRRLEALLREVEQHCPCGARPESLTTHPHVGGCPVAAAIAVLAALPAEQCICPDDGDGMALYRSDCPNELHAKRARALPAEPEKENSRE